VPSKLNSIRDKRLLQAAFQQIELILVQARYTALLI
jgi:hypothetical protein